MYATAAESREQVTDFYRRVQAPSDATIGNCRWTHAAPCPGGPRSAGIPPCTRCSCTRSRKPPRHAGHADIIRESIDGAAGLREGVSNMPAEAGSAWKQHYDKLDQIAQSVP